MPPLDLWQPLLNGLEFVIRGSSQRDVVVPVSESLYPAIRCLELVRRFITMMMANQLSHGNTEEALIHTKTLVPPCPILQLIQLNFSGSESALAPKKL